MVAVADYVDFFSSLHHAANMGRMLRPEGEPLTPNWRHLPIAYHGRAGHAGPKRHAGAPSVRPAAAGADEAPSFGPSTRLDLELEAGFVVGVPSRRASRCRSSGRSSTCSG